MKLSVPANTDIDILPVLKSYGTSEIYGKWPSDFFGGGRPTYMAASMSRHRFSKYVRAVHDVGLEFNYLLNSACFGNEEWTKRFHRELNALLDWLTELRVEILTVSAPFLVQMIKARYPHFKIKVGIYAQVDTVKRAKFWDDLGVDAINLESFSINREFEKLARIRRSVSADLVLIANHFCQPNCPYQIQHQNGHAHASGKSSKFYIDYPIIQCQKNRLTHKELFISAGWIRPEDLCVYEELGYTTFKLLERNIPSQALVQRARAYFERKFEGNLADLLLSWGFRDKAPRFSWSFLLRHFKAWKMPRRLAGTSMDFLRQQGMFFTKEKTPVFIDTKKIPDDFLRPFRTGSCLDRECTDCGYCSHIAETAVTIDPDFLEQAMPVYQRIQDQLVTGSAFGLR